MAGLGLAKKVGLIAAGLGTGGAAGNIESYTAMTVLPAAK